jgi:hypothetical protein
LPRLLWNQIFWISFSGIAGMTGLYNQLLVGMGFFEDLTRPGLELQSFDSQTPKKVGLQMWATGVQLFFFCIYSFEKLGMLICLTILII